MAKPKPAYGACIPNRFRIDQFDSFGRSRGDRPKCCMLRAHEMLVDGPAEHLQEGIEIAVYI